jgi:hypothetical protein
VGEPLPAGSAGRGGPAVGDGGSRAATTLTPAAGTETGAANDAGAEPGNGQAPRRRRRAASRPAGPPQPANPED